MILFWVQEGCNSDGTYNTKIFSCEIERETPKTFIVKTPCLGSYWMKVINKNRIGSQFWHSQKEALQAQSESVRHRLQKSPGNKYLLGQIKNLEVLLSKEQ